MFDNAGNCVGDGKRDITIDTIKQRWDLASNQGITEGQRWGIENRLRVETHSYRFEDEAIVNAGSQVAPQILNARFAGTAARMPSLLYVRETRLRAFNLDGRTSGGPATWTGNALRIDMSGEPLITTGSVTNAFYRYDATAGWQTATPRQVVDELEARYPAGR